METDRSHTLIEYGVPDGYRNQLFTEGYRKKALRKRWSYWGFSGLYLLHVVTLPAWAPNLLVYLFYAAGPVLLASFFFDLRFWHKVRFCPNCDAVTHWPSWTTTMDFCHNCGRLLDPTSFLIDPPSKLNLNDERYREEGKPIRKLIIMVIL